MKKCLNIYSILYHDLAIYNSCDFKLINYRVYK